jgi:hypothetical protein
MDDGDPGRALTAKQRPDDDMLKWRSAAALPDHAGHSQRQSTPALQDAVPPLYLLHQFEVKAVGSMLGGFTYRYPLRDGEIPKPVPASRQREALRALLTTLSTSTLWPGGRVLQLMSPRPPTSSDEAFSGDQKARRTRSFRTG